jgi:hypothetical protein
MKFLKVLKQVDIFKLPVNTFFTYRDKKLNKKSYRILHGSKAGGCLTILFAMAMMNVLVLNVHRMFSGELDITKQELYSNPMTTNETSIANIYDSQYMASL